MEAEDEHTSRKYLGKLFKGKDQSGELVWTSAESIIFNTIGRHYN